MININTFSAFGFPAGLQVHSLSLSLCVCVCVLTRLLPLGCVCWCSVSVGQHRGAIRPAPTTSPQNALHTNRTQPFGITPLLPILDCTAVRSFCPASRSPSRPVHFLLKGSCYTSCRDHLSESL